MPIAVLMHSDLRSPILALPRSEDLDIRLVRPGVNASRQRSILVNIRPSLLLVAKKAMFPSSARAEGDLLDITLVLTFALFRRNAVDADLYSQSDS
jgi:hypothetical protein